MLLYLLNSFIITQSADNLLISSNFSAGSGTDIDPYQISNIKELKLLRDNIKYYNQSFILTKNLTFQNSDYQNPGLGWSVIGNESFSFSGSFDGSGYSINNLF